MISDTVVVSFRQLSVFSIRVVRTVCQIMLLMSAACGTPVEPDIEGVWGGEDVSLVLMRDGGQLQYACGNGTIGPDWSVENDGSFTATGDHFFGGGPLPAEGRTPHPATYNGTLRDDELTLSVHVVDQETTLGPFVLIRNGPVVHEICF